MNSMHCRAIQDFALSVGMRDTKGLGIEYRFDDGAEYRVIDHLKRYAVQDAWRPVPISNSPLVMALVGFFIGLGLGIVLARVIL